MPLPLHHTALVINEGIIKPPAPPHIILWQGLTSQWKTRWHFRWARWYLPWLPAHRRGSNEVAELLRGDSFGRWCHEARPGDKTSNWMDEIDWTSRCRSGPCWFGHLRETRKNSSLGIKKYCFLCRCVYTHIYAHIYIDVIYRYICIYRQRWYLHVSIVKIGLLF